MQANLWLIKPRLFDCARAKIARDYRLNEPATPEDLSEQVLQSLDQRAFENPLDREYDNNEIFRAVVRALGSNNRSWRSFLVNHDEIEQLLFGYRVEKVRQHPPNLLDLARLLPGQTGRADARAILHWMNRLAETRNYYAAIVRAAAEIQNRFKDRDGHFMPFHNLFLCIVAHFTNDRMQSRKWPGMGFALGSEFLRNLHWNGFKPDRHIKRLLSHWTKDQIDVHQATERLQFVIGRKDRALLDNLSSSLIGMEITPKYYKANLSQVDNLIWLLGAYVEK
jgi:hypothetical protein